MEDFCEYYCLNIIVNINAIITLNIPVNTTLKYYYSQALNEKLKLMEGTINFFSKKLLDHEIFSSMIHWATKFYLEKLENPPVPPSYMLNVRSLNHSLKIFLQFSKLVYLVLISH